MNEDRIVLDFESNKQSKHIEISSKKDDRLRNKSVFHLIDKLNMMGDENFDIKYFSTMFLNEALGYFKKYEGQ